MSKVLIIHVPDDAAALRLLERVYAAPLAVTDKGIIVDTADDWFREPVAHLLTFDEFVQLVATRE